MKALSKRRINKLIDFCNWYIDRYTIKDNLFTSHNTSDMLDTSNLFSRFDIYLCVCYKLYFLKPIPKYLYKDIYKHRNQHLKYSMEFCLGQALALFRKQRDRMQYIEDLKKRLLED